METNKANYTKNSLQVRDIVQVGLFSAIIFAATTAIHIPYGNGGVIHLGDSMVFLAALLFGKKKAAFAGAIGMTLFDVLNGYVVWAPFTLVIKALMGYIAGSIAYSGNSKGESLLRNAAGMVLGGLWMTAGYYIAEAIITGNVISPIIGVPGNLLQFGAGAVIALFISAALKGTRYFNR